MFIIFLFAAILMMTSFILISTMIMFVYRFKTLLYFGYTNDDITNEIIITSFCSAAGIVICWITCILHQHLSKLLPLVLIVSIVMFVMSSVCVFYNFTIYKQILSQTGNTTQLKTVTMKFEEGLNSTLWYTSRQIPHNGDMVRHWVDMQDQLECCGVESSQDWINLKVCHMIPCCVRDYVNKPNFQFKAAPGCLHKAVWYILFWLKLILGFRLILYLFQFCHMCFLIALYIREKKNNKKESEEGLLT